ncbi:MAG TPA: tetratricopeptide repeat protein [Thermoanaerobaculia bacterium]|nr:tetratricopeptide repeat protein [Thermoanaerobaculia bacterium]
MRDSHLTPEILHHLLTRDNDPEEHRLLLHHLAVCPACYKVAGYVLDLFEAGAIDLAFSTVDLDLARSRAEAPLLLAELGRHPYEAQQALVRQTPRFHSWGLAELLAAESIRFAPEDSSRAVEAAELAVLVSSLLEEHEPAEAAWLEELRAMTWAHLAKARHLLGELRSAEEAFRISDAHWKNAESAGNVLGYEAKILALKASLRLNQGRLEEALSLLDQAFAAEPAPSLAASILISRARVLEEQGDLEAAIRLFGEAAETIDRDKDPRLFLCARHNLLDALSKDRRYREAEALLPKVQALARAEGNELDLVRLSWIEGRLLAAEGRPEEAIGRFIAVRDTFLVHRMGYDAALVSLELAIVLLQLERVPEVQTLALETYRVFAAEDVHREALVAVALFQEAAAKGKLTLELASSISRYLFRARRNPMLRFERTG